MVGRPNQQILSTANRSGIEKTTDEYQPNPVAHRAYLHVFSADAGTLDVDIKMSDGTWREKSTHAVTANTLLVVELTYVPLYIRGRFTASAETGNVLIDAGFSGNVS